MATDSLEQKILANEAKLEDYRQFIRSKSGDLRSKGVFGGFHYLATIENAQHRIDSFADLRPWFIEHVIPIKKPINQGHAKPLYHEQDNLQGENRIFSYLTPKVRAARWAIWMAVIVGTPYAIRIAFSLPSGNIDKVASLIFQVIVALVVFPPIAFLLGWITAGSIRGPSSLQNSSTDESMKECPFCAEIIKRKAIRCRYCGSDLPSV